MENSYELTCLISPSLDETEREKFVEQIKESIIKKEGEIINVNPLSEVALAYPIKDHNKAHMLIIDLKLEGEKMGELKTELNEKESLLRFFLIRKNKERQQKPIRTKERKDTAEKIEIEDIDKTIEEILNPSKEEKTSEEEKNESQ